ESSYCQGDSEKFIFHLFDKEGFIYFSKQYGIYQPTIITLYRKGKPVKIIEYSAELSTPRKRIFKKTKENRIVAAKDFEDRVIALKKDIRQRKRELEDYVSNKKKFGNPGKIKKEVLKKEARKTIKELSNSLKKTGYSGTYFYRKPRQNEDAMITGKNVRVRNKPGTKSKVIATVSSYDFSFLVMSIGKSETIRPWGTHKWYKVSHESRTGKAIEGWVFGAFIAPDVFSGK
ncbi:MAG: SH3 domain-containing protein, partial [bacterium]|nr:SH3 domain-containing protein [bacterium]